MYKNTPFKSALLNLCLLVLPIEAIATQELEKKTYQCDDRIADGGHEIQFTETDGSYLDVFIFEKSNNTTVLLGRGRVSLQERFGEKQVYSNDIFDSTIKIVITDANLVGERELSAQFTNKIRVISIPIEGKMICSQWDKHE